MDKELLIQAKKILINGSKSDLDELLKSMPENEQKELLVNILAESSSILQDGKLSNVKTRPLLYYIIQNAERRGIKEGKDVYVTYADQRKLGKINSTYGYEMGDKALESFIESLHVGFEGVKKSNYQIVRMGGDEFCIVTIGESLEELTEELKESKTIANNVRLMHDGKRINYKVDFAFGSTKLDYSNGKTLRQLIDMAKSETYYSKKLQEAEEIAEVSKLVVRDKEKEHEKRKVILDYAKKVKNDLHNEKEYEYELIDKRNCDEKENSRRRKKSNDVDFDFIILLSQISESKGLKREVLIDQLYSYDVDKLKDNYMSFAENFVREGRKGFVKRSSLDTVSDVTIDDSNKKACYIELDNLKLVNSARGHAGGDVYIESFVKIIEDSIVECEAQDNSIVVKMSGNGLVLLYDEGYEEIISSILDKVKDYTNKDIDIPMDVYFEEMNPKTFSKEDLEEEYLIASKNLGDVKKEKNALKQKVITSEKDYEIYYERETFSLSEVRETITDELSDIPEDKMEGKKAKELLDELSALDELDNEIKNHMDLKTSKEKIVEDEIDE